MRQIKGAYVPEGLKKTRNLNIRMTNEQYSEIQKIAFKKNMNMSFVVRELLSKALYKFSKK